MLLQPVKIRIRVAPKHGVQRSIRERAGCDSES